MNNLQTLEEKDELCARILELKEKERVIKEEMKDIRATKKENSDELKDLKEELVEMMDVGEEFEFNEDRLELKSKIDNRFFSLGGESEGNLLRLDSPTAQKAIKACKTLELQPSKLVFEVSKYPHKLSKAEGLIGKSGSGLV